MSRNRQNTASTEKWSSKGLELEPKSRDVKAEEVCVGSIVWLRQRRSNEEEITCVREGHCSDDFKLLDNGYRHPVIVLKIWQRRGSTELGDLMLGVSDLTTFKDTPFRQYINHRNLIKFEESIPILQPSEITNSNIEQLSLASGGLDRKSYVRLQHLLLVSVKCLWMYRWTEGSHAYDHRLDQKSYEKVMSELGVEADMYESTGAVMNTGQLRNISLARKEAMELYENYRLQSEGNSNSNKGKGPDYIGSYTASPALADTNQHQETPDGVPNPKTMETSVQEWPQPQQTFDTKPAANQRPLEPLDQFPQKPSRMRIPYGIFPEYPDSLHVDNLTYNTSGGILNADTSGCSSGHLPAYQQTPVQPLAGAYFTPAPVPTFFPPAVQNNFYFHGSTAHFDAPVNPIDHGVQSNHMAQPAYRSVGQQFGRGSGEGFNNQNLQQTAQQIGQTGLLLREQDRYQQLPQRMGQEMAQPFPLYNQMTERYNPNLTTPQYQPPLTGTNFCPSTPPTRAQASVWSSGFPLEPHQRPNQNFQPRVPPPSQRNTASTSFSGMRNPDDAFRDIGLPPQTPAPHPEPYISPYKRRQSRPPNAHGEQEEDWY